MFSNTLVLEVSSQGSVKYIQDVCDFFIILNWQKPQIKTLSFMIEFLQLSDCLTCHLNLMGLIQTSVVKKKKKNKFR